MTSSELAERLAAKLELTPSESSKYLDTILKDLYGNLGNGVGLEVRGFGSISVNLMKPKMGRNPKTGDKVEVPERLKLLFKPSKSFKAKLKDKNAVKSNK